MKKKVLPLLLALCLVAALVTVSAFAAESEKSTEADSFAALQNALSSDFNKIKLTGDIEVTAMLTISHNVTIVGDGTHTVKYGGSYTGTMFTISNSAKVTFENVKIDAGGGDWKFKDSGAIETAVQKSWNEELVDVGEIIEDSHAIASTAALIMLSGSDNTLVLDGGTQITGFYAAGSTIISASGTTDNTVIFNDCKIDHNYRGGGNSLLSTYGTNTCYEFNNGAKITGNYTVGNGGMIDVRGGSQVYINEGAEFSGNMAIGSNGAMFMTWSNSAQHSKVTMSGGTIQNNTAFWKSGNAWGCMIYVHTGGEFEMTGGKIVNNTGAKVGAVSTNANNTVENATQLLGGEIGSNRGSTTSGCGEIYITASAAIGANITITGDVTVDGHAHLTNNGTINGNVGVYSSNYDGYSTFENNGTITGTLYIQNGAQVTNTKTIRGDVSIINEMRSPLDETEGAFGNSNFENTGEIVGNMNLCPGSTVTNSGTVDGNVTVQNGADLLLDGGGTVKKNVTVYPGGEVRTTDPSRQGTIGGTLTFQYGGNPDTEENPNEDHQRMEDIFEDSNIIAGNVVYNHHTHTPKANSMQTVDGNCTTPAGTTYICATCGGTYYIGYEAKEPPEAEGHKWELASDTTHNVAATAESDGYTKEECSVCSLVRYEIIPATGHTVTPPIVSDNTGKITCGTCSKQLTIEYQGTHTGTGHHWADPVMVEGQCSGTSAGTPDKMLFVCTTPGCHASCTVSFQNQTHNYEFAPIDNVTKISNCADAANGKRNGTYRMAVVCTHCGIIISGTEVNMTGDNAALPYEHVWYIDRTARPTKSICTDEVYYTYKCAICSETKTDIVEAATSHQWVRDEATGLFVCNARIGSDLHLCGQVQNGINISYQPRGGDTSETAAPGFIKAQRKGHLPGEVVDLWFPADNWTKETAVGQSVFVGWSTYDFGAEPLTEAPVVPAGETLYTAAGAVKTVTIPEDEDLVLYAVWALDLNRNNNPDYDTANETRYTLKYNVNGGTGATFSDHTGLLEGASYPLADGSALTKESGSDKLVFAGWTLEQTKASSLVVPAEGVTLTPIYETPGNSNTPVVKTELTWETGNEIEILHSPYKVNATDATSSTITLYAVYAKTASGSGSKPGFEANYYHVEYYANGGTAKSGYTVDAQGLFYTCNDYHVNGSTLAGGDYLSVSQANLMIERDSAVLVGWSVEKHTGLITEEGDANSLNLITNNIAQTFAGENIKVYAVWAQDRNKNSVGDYLEYRYTFTYNNNAYLSATTAGGSLAHTLDTPLTVYGSVPADNSGSILYACGNDGLPTARAESYTYVLNGEYVELAINTKLTADGNGHHYVQVGWSGFCHPAATSMNDLRNWLIYQEGNPTSNNINGISYEGKFYRHIQSELYTTAYVVWAIDDNRNGIADFMDSPELPPISALGTVKSASTSHGSFTVSNSHATPGQTVKVTPKPASGYAVGRVVVTDNRGKSVSVTRNADGTYSFVMPKLSQLPVTVSVDFLCGGGTKCPGKTFPDMDNTQYYHIPMDYMVLNGYISGFPDGTLQPNGVSTRAQMLTIMAQVCGVKVMGSNPWYKAAIDWAKSHDYSDGLRPDAPVQREEIVAILWRMANKPASTQSLAKYGDAAKVNDWAKTAMAWAVEKGIMTGRDNNLVPQGIATRAELATFIYNYITKA